MIVFSCQSVCSILSPKIRIWAVILGIFCLTSIATAANNTKLDSVFSIYHPTSDTTALDKNLKILLSYLDSTNHYNQLNTTHFIKLNELSEKLKDTSSIVEITSVYDRLGVKSRNNGDYFVALNYHQMALKLARKTKDNKREAIVLNNIGVLHRRLDNYEQALDYHMQAQKIAEGNNDLYTKTIAMNSIGNIQVAIGNLDAAENLFIQSYEIELQLNNQLGIAINLNNLGNVFKEKGDFDKAVDYYSRSLKVNQEIDNKKGVAICYNDLGNIFQAQGNQLKGLKYLQMAFQINLKLNDKNYLAYSYIQLGESYVDLGFDDLAIKYLLPGLELSKEINSKYNIADAYNSLFKLTYNQGKYKEAVQYLQMANQYNDSILNLNIRKEIARLQINFDNERQIVQINALQQQALISQLEIKRQKSIALAMIGAFVLALILVTFLLFYLRNKNKTNQLLTHKNALIEQAGKELDSYAKLLLAAKKEAEKNSRIKSEFLTNMSHEIRTPLNSVIGFSELLYQSTKNPKHLSYLKTISHSGKSLLTLINDILDLSKIEAEKFDIQYTSVDIRAIVTEITQLFSENAVQKDLQLVNNISSKFPDKILFSDIRFRQILFNLVGNAIKFTSHGKIEIIIDCDEINEDSLEMILYVKDTGSGISTEDKQQIFKPFSQTESTSMQNGTGLGLTITKRLVKMMNGEIKVESYPQKGSIFSVYFSNIAIVSKATKPSYQYIDSDLEFHILFIAPDDCSSSSYFQSIPESSIIKKHCYNSKEGHKQLSICDLIIYYQRIDTDIETINKLLSNNQIKASTQILLIGNYPNDFKTPINATILSNHTKVDEFIYCVLQTLKIQKSESIPSPFFTQSILYAENPEFIDQNKRIFKDYYLTAVNTKLINHIQLFIKSLRNWAQNSTMKASWLSVMNWKEEQLILIQRVSMYF